jgi:hypothetical protein
MVSELEGRGVTRSRRPRERGSPKYRRTALGWLERYLEGCNGYVNPSGRGKDVDVDAPTLASKAEEVQPL